jgi:thymidylate synthase (FAD)
MITKSCSICNRQDHLIAIRQIEPQWPIFYKDNQFAILCEGCADNSSISSIKQTYLLHSPSLDEDISQQSIVYHPIKNGILHLISYSGDESTVISAARISTNTKLGDSNRDIALLNRLIRDEHLSPFEHVHLTFFIQCPIYVWRQWIRHRTAHTNEYSMRYCEAMDIFGYDETDFSDEQKDFLDAAFIQQYKIYLSLLNSGCAREKARIVLPLATVTKAIWTIDLRNLLHFIKLRFSPEAQKEIYLYAESIYGIVKRLFPNIAASFDNWVINSVKLSQNHLNLIRNALVSSNIDLQKLYNSILEEGSRMNISQKEIKNICKAFGISEN